MAHDPSHRVGWKSAANLWVLPGCCSPLELYGWPGMKQWNPGSQLVQPGDSCTVWTHDQCGTIGWQTAINYDFNRFESGMGGSWVNHLSSLISMFLLSRVWTGGVLYLGKGIKHHPCCWLANSCIHKLFIVISDICICKHIYTIFTILYMHNPLSTTATANGVNGQCRTPTSTKQWQVNREPMVKFEDGYMVYLF